MSQYKGNPLTQSIPGANDSEYEEEEKENNSIVWQHENMLPKTMNSTKKSKASKAPS